MTDKNLAPVCGLCKRDAVKGVKGTVLFKLVNNPVRELRSLTVCGDGGLKPPLPSIGNDHRLKSVAFSNGVN